MQNIYTIDQVAKKLQVSLLTIRRYIKAKKLPASKIGKGYRIMENDILNFLKKSKV